MKKPLLIILSLLLSISLHSQSKAELGVAEIGLVVSDIKASEHFYKEILGLVEAGEFNIDQQFSLETGAANDQPFTIRMLKQRDLPSATILKLAFFKKTTKQLMLDGINTQSGVNYITFHYDAKGFKKVTQSIETAGLEKTGWVKRDSFQLYFIKDPDGLFVEIIGPPEN